MDAALKSLDANRDRMIETVTQWANINSNSYHVTGLERMSVALTQAFSVLECEGKVLSLPPIEQISADGVTRRVDLGPLLQFWKRKDAPIQILLVGHMDTVYDIDHPFQKAIRQSESILTGPGVTDMKGGLCVMLEALKAFEQSPIAKQLGWEVIINPDEEIGSLGSASFLAERAKAHQLALLFEPAMDEAGTFAGERKGSGNFTVIVHGRAAHAGRDFLQGRNAIVQLAHVISEIQALNGKREGVTLNVGQVQGGSAVNVVPALAICQIDVRFQDLKDEAWVNEHLKSIVFAANQPEGFTVELKGHFNRKPKTITGKTLALYEMVSELAKTLGQDIHWKPSGGCCDGNNLSEAGLPNIDTLGVYGGKIHSEEEYLLVDSLVSRAKLTTAILFHLNQGKF